MVVIIAGCILMIMGASLVLCYIALKKLNYDLQQLYGDF